MHIGECPTGAADGVIVRSRLTIVANDAIGPAHLGDKPGVDKVVQRVVDGAVGDVWLPPAHAIEYLRGGRMVLPPGHGLEHSLALPCKSSGRYWGLYHAFIVAHGHDQRGAICAGGSHPYKLGQSAYLL